MFTLALKSCPLTWNEITILLYRDAAHTVHPLAGQGLNQGLADVECLARVIETSLLSGSDIGKPKYRILLSCMKLILVQIIPSPDKKIDVLYHHPFSYDNLRKHPFVDSILKRALLAKLGHAGHGRQAFKAV